MLPDHVWPVSLNDHLVEAPRLWVDRLSRGKAQTAPQPIASRDGREGWKFGDTVLYLSAMLSGPLYRVNPGSPIRRFDDIDKSAWDPAARIAAMDQDKVAVHTLMPHLCGFAGERFRLLREPALWAECVRVYNDFVFTEFCTHDLDRLAAVALICLVEPEEAVREIERVAAMGARGISLPTDPGALGLPTYHSDMWTRVWDAADAAGLPIFLHIGSKGAAWSEAPHHRPIGTLVTAANFDAMEAAADLVFSPLLYDRPVRRIVLVEANVSWFPYLEERVDFATHRRPDGVPPGTRKASEIMRTQILGTFIHDPIAIAHRHEIGLERFLWQSDFPHPDSVWPDSRKILTKQLMDVPEAEAIQIAVGNARALLRLPEPSKARGVGVGNSKDGHG
jgi:predicted TIM-barrel fold metal-dependent hydrolase